MNVLVTVIAVYIGSHTLIELINSGHDVLVLDNLSILTIKTLDKI